VLTAIVVVGLTPCTFWAAKRGHNFNFLGPFLFAAILVLMVYCLLQVMDFCAPFPLSLSFSIDLSYMDFSFCYIFLPLGRVGKTIYCWIAAIMFSGFIVYDTDNLIKHYTYDEHIIASISLYLDIANLFSALLNLLSWVTIMHIVCSYVSFSELRSLTGEPRFLSWKCRYYNWA